MFVSSLSKVTSPLTVISGDGIFFSRSMSIVSSIKGLWKKPDDKVTESADELPLQPVGYEAKVSWQHLDEEQINKICDKSGLDDQLKELERRQLLGPVKFYQMREYKREHVKKFYAQYGEDSGIKAGVCWPNVEELAFHDKFEKTFYPSIEKLMADNVKEKQRIVNVKKEREDLVTKGLAQREQMIADYYKKREEKLKEEEEANKRNEKLVAEVREYLGFNIEKSDPRFQEALAKKEEEERAKAKAANKKDKNAKLAALLQKMLDLPSDKL